MLEGVGIFATDTVYGMGCVVSAQNPALQEIFALKNRPHTKKLPILAPSITAAFACAAECTQQARLLAQAFWPGALTLIVRANDILPSEYVASDGSVAVRVPALPALITCMKEMGVLLANTSANLHGEPDPYSLQDVPKRFLQAASWTLDKGVLPFSAPSTIVDVRKPTQSVKIIREGAILAKDIGEEFLRCR